MARSSAFALAVALAAASCGTARDAPPKSGATTMITEQQALDIARKDAATAYRDLSIYTVRVSRKPDGWHVDYDLTDPSMLGGGPHYVISESGEITQRRFEQ
jgi:hypothetical protein